MSVVTLPLTVRALRAEIAAMFAHAGIDNPHAEARDIIAAVLDQPRFWAAAHAEDAIEGSAVRAAAERRVRGMPFAYSVGKAAFRYLTLIVDERVLIPRQETERLVDHVLAATGGCGVAADIGTGSGCIALALACEGKFERVIATDLSPDAQAVTRMNAESLRGLRTPVEIRGGDLLTPLSASDCITVIVSNPPYIAAQEMPDLPVSVRDFEPHLALVSENDGLEHTFRIIDEAPRVLRSGGLLALEVDSRRAQRVECALHDRSPFCEVKVHNDFTGRARYVLARVR